ncbi:MAG: hypothetical protein QXT72_00780 [Candidatus Micrarchaeia archaeon]
MEEFNYKVNESTRKFIEDDFKERFKKTGNSILLEKPFQKVAEYYIRQNVPAYLRTQNVLSSNSDAIKLMQKTLDEFIYKIESKELGWQYLLRKDGYECIKLFDNVGENIIDYSYRDPTQKPPITVELQVKNMLNRWISEMNNEKETELNKEDESKDENIE